MAHVINRQKQNEHEQKFYKFNLFAQNLENYEVILLYFDVRWTRIVENKINTSQLFFFMIFGTSLELSYSLRVKIVMELNDLIVGLILSTIIPILYYLYYVSRSKSKFLPPAYKGWFPWLGCAFEFGKNPLDFIAQKKEVQCIFLHTKHF